jgi:hypothetical protein
MHGKQKAQWVYAEGKPNAISGVEYFYKKTSPESNRLDNTVYAATKRSDASGRYITQQNIGIDYDVVADMREQESSSTTSGIGGNLDTFFAAIFPGVVPSVIPKMSKEKVRFRSAVITKVINRYGLIEKVRAHDLGSTVETKNLLYDAETGEVLLTETQNQFDDPIYSFTYPAHWGYDGMGMAYKNAGLKGKAENEDLYQHFREGDEVLVAGTKAWVEEAWDDELELIDREGNEVPATGDIKVLRSARRNQQTVAIGSVVSLKNPLQDINNDGVFDVLSFTNVNVLNASAVEFESEWQQPCECTVKEETSDGSETGVITSTNPFIRGERGNWRLNRSFTFLTDRSHTRLNDNPDIRHDGFFEVFDPFWSAPPPDYDYNWNSSPRDWTSTSTVTVYNTTGSELENVDALGRYSAALYGYSQTLPKAVGNNVMHKELGFDGFEDYDNGTCADEHFSFRQSRNNVSEDEAHSGRRSIKVLPNSSVELIKKFGCPGEDDEEGGGEGEER